ncbi:hypothetical protein CMI47_13675 [Candidatus Pacearchaeota archaeon]|nr:hypothetical protein [Candidatus Pacearchaeota archaeon]|tara:strand:+ start:2021 stop:2284 length:264 start_codon:yes stop_codon:yes gene_type:complete
MTNWLYGGVAIAGLTAASLLTGCETTPSTTYHPSGIPSATIVKNVMGPHEPELESGDRAGAAMNRDYFQARANKAEAKSLINELSQR